MAVMLHTDCPIRQIPQDVVPAKIPSEKGCFTNVTGETSAPLGEVEVEAELRIRHSVGGGHR